MRINTPNRCFSVVPLSILGLCLAVAAPAFAGKGDPCSTNGSIEVTAISPAQYSYTLGVGGDKVFSFTVSSPPVVLNGNCDQTLPKVFGSGNGDVPTVLPFEVEIKEIELVGGTIASTTEAALRAALSAFSTQPFQLTPPGSGTSQTITFKFTNTVAVPVGTYDLTVQVKPESSSGVGVTNQSFSIQVKQAQAVDTQPPTVDIVTPALNAPMIKLNDSLAVNFTANDPPENGVGTGVIAVRAAITKSCGASTFSYNLTPMLSVSPTLPVAADVFATASTAVTPWLYVGNFTLTAEADDNAGHTGSADRAFSAGTTINALPPISVPNRQFNTGSTLPIKFTITGASGAFLPPMESLIVRITPPSGPAEDRVPGTSSNNVRWELDEYSNATQYITNYPIPVIGKYRVDVLIEDVCGTPALQGGFDFFAASKGGKM